MRWKMLEGDFAYLDPGDFAVCVENTYLKKYNINALAFTYLMAHKQAEAAEAIFRANTKLFPKSPNLFIVV
jgi:hypothetical protein